MDSGLNTSQSTGSEDAADNNHIIEEPESEKPDQEEVSRKRKSGSLETQESNQPYQKRPRKKSSRCWRYLDQVEEKNQRFVICKLCKSKMKLGSSGCTTTLNRHVDKCKRTHGQTSQATLQFQPSDSVSSEVTLGNFKYDHAEMRKVISHYILVNELPFRHVESFMFDKVMRTATPFWQKISRHVVKKDCVSTYEIEKNKLRELLKSVRKINITTDMWTSSHQKLGYMVVTGHWIDSDWNLNMRVLTFCNVPPPHSGFVISEALLKCFNEWGIIDKIGTLIVDNAAANDDGLDPTQEIVDQVRDGVKYIAASESRRIKFAEISMSLGLKCKKLILDVSTRWNSTDNMLSCAIEFKNVFLIYSIADQGFREYVPSADDWDRVAGVCSFLQVFSDVTKVVSRTEEDKEANKKRHESSEMSSCDAKFMYEQRETPNGLNDYESFIRESGGIIEPTKSELEEYLSEQIVAPTSKFDVIA
ncbi:zinc finger BED domain-containing protein RICESLEEPER 2-like [Daucus carota subsp. sativus]|uniref:zinc finger BED domain-containing protein RICESLEEPER 2-like n=1 Tax=Daucus carota subsp. sativus TaxID=79200 RepID=UPI0007F013BF|nr:PREDICTED: zinc finger BED domain-containing protein RICESLEEPER 2-like [Daucus carota subsp. sativus]